MSSKSSVGEKKAAAIAALTRVEAHMAATPSSDPDAVNILHMPEEVLLHIFTFLFVEDLLVVGAVCRSFRSVSKDDGLANNYRRNVNVSFIGSSGAGKSTLVGHLQLLLGETKQVDIKSAAEAAQSFSSRPYSKFTFIASRRKRDREVGTTSDNNYLHVLGSRHPLGFTLIDTPGHRDFFKNTLRGFLQSDMAIWVVDKVHNEQEEYCRANSFCEAPLMIAGANMRCAIIVVNKMDEREWSTSKFDEIKIKLAQILTKRRIKTDNVMIVPVSAAYGWNMVHRTVVPPGEEKKEDIRVTYQGPTLWEAMMKLAANTPKKALKKPFRMSVVKMWNTTLLSGEKRRGLILGTVLQGGIKINSTVRLSPPPNAFPNQDLTVWGIGHGKLKRNLAPPGCLVALLLPAGKTIPPNHKSGQDGSGWVAYNPAKEPTLMAESRCFIAQVMLFHGKSTNPALPPANKFKVNVDYTPLFHFVSGTFTGRVTAIHQARDMKTRATERNPKFAGGTGKLFTMTITTKAPHVIEPYAKNHVFGRFFISDNSALVGAGVVVAAISSHMSPSFVEGLRSVQPKPRAGTTPSAPAYKLPARCEDSCTVNWPYAAASIAYRKPDKARLVHGVCYNCFFDAYTACPSVIDNAYRPA